MNPSQDVSDTLGDSQDTSPPQTSIEKAQVDKEKEMAELLMTMDNYKAIVLVFFMLFLLFLSSFFVNMISSLDTRCSN